MDALLEEVKAYLDITWNDESTNKKLNSMIKRAKKRIDELGGCSFDYSEEDLPKELLLNRVMYDRSGALDEFETNYRKEIIYLQNRERVKRNDIKET